MPGLEQPSFLGLLCVLAAWQLCTDLMQHRYSYMYMSHAQLESWDLQAPGGAQCDSLHLPA
jgi:hypothetical protein